MGGISVFICLVAEKNLLLEFIFFLGKSQRMEMVTYSSLKIVLN